MSSNNNLKFSIKPFRQTGLSSFAHGSNMDQSTAMSAFSSLSTAIDEIHFRNASLLSFEELYRNAYNLVLHKHGGLLYDGVAERLGHHLEKSAEDLVHMAVGLDAASAGGAAASRGGSVLNGGGGGGNIDDINASIVFLASLSSTWKEHRVTMVMVRDIFMYMDRTYVQQNRKMTVYELGLFLFRRVVWERELTATEEGDDGRQGKMVSGGQEKGRQNKQQQIMDADPPRTLGNVASTLLLRVIRQDRLDRLDDAPQRIALLRSCIHMLLELSMPNVVCNTASEYPRGGNSSAIPVYERDFEEAFLGETQDFYRNESAGRLSHATGLGGGDASDNITMDSFSSKLPAKYSAMEYVHLAKSRIEQEKARASSLDLPPPTRAQLLRIVETELIERHAKTLVDMEGSGFAFLLKEVTSNNATGGVAAAGEGNTVPIDRERIADLGIMYELFSRVPSSVNHLRDALSERIRIDGRSLVRDQETNASPPAAFVKGVLAMRERFGAVVTESLKGEKKSQKRMKEAFEDFLNADARAANCLAVYVDELLRVGLRGADERKVAAELDRVIVIFRYLADKDVFEAYYKNHLAKRLLGNKSGSEEAERAMVSLLKAECGYQFTSKLEGMFNDMRISKETAEKYRSHKKSLVAAAADPRDVENGGKSVDVEVSVLTTGYWPSQNVEPCILPPPVKAAMDRFQKYYLNTYTGRKLSWQTSTGSAEIRATFPPTKGSTKPRRHDLTVTTYQMCILVLFNNRDTLTLKQIREETQIPEDELRRHLVSLCTPKHRILKKGSKGKGISGDDDTFTYNADYTSKMTRVKVPMVSMRDATLGPNAEGGAGEGASSNAAAAISGASSANNASVLVDGSPSVPASVEEDRRHLLEAAIVRIMKARKTLNHNDLVAEATKQLSGRFVPPPQFVKKRVESLIEREYLERDENDRKLYRYMA
ncbi:hypothetical protein ACHAWX_002454 [Stephanocyclus meneghinianus]